MLSFWRDDLKTLKFSTNDWSQLDSPEAPSLEKITAEYSERFQCEVYPARYVIDGAPQLELSVAIDEIDDASKAIESFFRGGEISDHSATWAALYRKLEALIRSHERSNPAFHFTPAGAAVAAFNKIRYGFKPLRLEGYRAVKLRELRDGRLSPILSLGRVPKNTSNEGGHLFRFHFEDRSSKEPRRIADMVLVDATGAHRSFLYEGKAPHVSAFTGKLLYTPNQGQKLPTYFRDRPAEKVPPPASHCMTFQTALSEENRVEIETMLDRRVERLENRAHAIQVDLSDIPNWPDLRARLFAGENIAGDRNIFNGIAARLRAVFTPPRGQTYLPVDAAVVMAMECVQDGSADAILGGISVGRKMSVPTVVHSGISDLRLCGVGYAHAYALEKRPDHISWPTDNVPFDLSEPDELGDNGYTVSLKVDGHLRQVLVEP